MLANITANWTASLSIYQYLLQRVGVTLHKCAVACLLGLTINIFPCILSTVHPTVVKRMEMIKFIFYTFQTCVGAPPQTMLNMNRVHVIAGSP